MRGSPSWDGAIVKLGLLLGAWAGSKLDLPVARVKLAEDLGYDSVWSSEAYGADALGPLAYLAAVTDRIKLATGVVQIGARTPAATAMGFATIEALAGRGRVIVGLGLSGPQIIEGWYGTPWANPIARTRDTVAIMRQVFAREGPVAYDGEAISLPYSGDDATGVGKPLKSILGTNPDTPIFIAAGGPANVALTAEIADGWLPMGFAPSNAASFRGTLERGAARSGRSLDTLSVQPGCGVRITDDVGAVIRAAKPQLAFYVGGMGSRDQNFHKDAMTRRGYGDAAERIQELFLAGHREEAVAAVPDEYVDDGGLYGSPQRIKDRLAPWTSCGATGLTINTDQDEALELMAGLLDTKP
jgi:F420-dependent oxidoreductase-like protein